MSYWIYAEAADHNKVYNHWDSTGTADSHGTNYTTGDPKFVNPTSDFELQGDSPCVDTGTWLTLTNGTGSGSTTMIVDDAKFFCDGWGLQDGDIIQLQGQTTTSKITDINYSTNTLTLEAALTWTDGLGVALEYSGSVPDKGAYEFETPGLNINVQLKRA